MAARKSNTSKKNQAKNSLEVVEVRVPLRKDGTVELEGSLVFVNSDGEENEVRFVRAKRDLGSGVGRQAVLNVSE
jgi:hypothetical protein